MTRQQPIELFMPPNILKAKAGGGLGGLDVAAMKRAELAMETLKTEFGDMAEGDVKALVEARDRFAKTPDTARRAALMRAAHDIKGNAPTFNYPLIARVAGSLSRLLGELAPAQAVPTGLVDAHVNAIQAIHRQNIQTSDDKLTQALCVELEARVSETLAKR